MNSYFYDTIFNLRNNEDILLYDRLINFNTNDEELVTDFLMLEYESESLNYPFIAPIYNGAAALWAAKTVYTISQLILYRENKEEELPSLLPNYIDVIDDSAILSADLCLRFLPQILIETKHIDPDDKLINLAENILQQWHYSSIGYTLNIGNFNFEEVTNNECLQQLYVDRIINKKDNLRAMVAPLNASIKAALGNHVSSFWKDFKITE